MKISYAITVCNELEEVKRLIPHLLEYKREEDEIVVMLDISNQTPDIINYLQKQRYDGTITLQGEYFDGHFADWKNKLKELCTGDYIFQIDADELPTQELITDLHLILGGNDIDLFLVPRDNKVKGITDKHIKKWGWRVDNLGRINFPDYQTRIYKNSPDIKWVNKVHERIEGYKTYAALPDEYFMHHIKTIERQERQNSYYDTL
jgi:hypothetical protein